MKERPILFRPEMVKAILDGRKTQTRRIVMPSPPKSFTLKNFTSESGYRYAADYSKARPKKPMRIRWDCPFGQPGDRLWVKERHSFIEVRHAKSSADGPRSWYLHIEYSDGTEDEHYIEDGKKPKQTRERGELGWRPSIYMPRWASRIALEVTGIRVERVQEIRYDDAVAEGIEHEYPKAIAQYCQLWDSLNAKRGFSWNRNPWVWVIEFRRWP